MGVPLLVALLIGGLLLKEARERKVNVEEFVKKGGVKALLTFTLFAIFFLPKEGKAMSVRFLL